MTHRNRIAVLLLAVAILAAALPANAQGNGNGPPEHAQDSNTGGNGNGNSGNNGVGNEPESALSSDEGDGGARDDIAGATGGAAQSESATPARPIPPASAANAGAGASPATPLPPAEPTTLTPDATLSAVQSGAALPLDAIAAEVRDRSGAEIIDARLLRVGQVLVYAVKTLTMAGAVRTEYYYGRSGLRVE